MTDSSILKKHDGGRQPAGKSHPQSSWGRLGHLRRVFCLFQGTKSLRKLQVIRPTLRGSQDDISQLICCFFQNYFR